MSLTYSATLPDLDQYCALVDGGMPKNNWLHCFTTDGLNLSGVQGQTAGTYTLQVTDNSEALPGTAQDLNLNPIVYGVRSTINVFEIEILSNTPQKWVLNHGIASKETDTLVTGTSDMTFTAVLYDPTGVQRAEAEYVTVKQANKSLPESSQTAVFVDEKAALLKFQVGGNTGSGGIVTQSSFTSTVASKNNQHRKVFPLNPQAGVPFTVAAPQPTEIQILYVQKDLLDASSLSGTQPLTAADVDNLKLHFTTPLGESSLASGNLVSGVTTLGDALTHSAASPIFLQEVAETVAGGDDALFMEGEMVDVHHGLFNVSLADSPAFTYNEELDVTQLIFNQAPPPVDALAVCYDYSGTAAAPVEKLIVSFTKPAAGTWNHPDAASATHVYGSIVDAAGNPDTVPDHSNDDRNSKGAQRQAPTWSMYSAAVAYADLFIREVHGDNGTGKAIAIAPATGYTYADDSNIGRAIHADIGTGHAQTKDDVATGQEIAVVDTDAAGQALNAPYVVRGKTYEIYVVSRLENGQPEFATNTADGDYGGYTQPQGWANSGITNAYYSDKQNHAAGSLVTIPGAALVAADVEVWQEALQTTASMKGDAPIKMRFSGSVTHPSSYPGYSSQANGSCGAGAGLEIRFKQATIDTGLATQQVVDLTLGTTTVSGPWCTDPASDGSNKLEIGTGGAATLEFAFANPDNHYHTVSIEFESTADARLTSCASGPARTFSTGAQNGTPLTKVANATFFAPLAPAAATHDDALGAGTEAIATNQATNVPNSEEHSKFTESTLGHDWSANPTARQTAAYNNLFRGIVNGKNGDTTNGIALVDTIGGFTSGVTPDPVNGANTNDYGIGALVNTAPYQTSQDDNASGAAANYGYVAESAPAAGDGFEGYALPTLTMLDGINYDNARVAQGNSIELSKSIGETRQLIPAMITSEPTIYTQGTAYAGCNASGGAATFVNHGQTDVVNAAGTAKIQVTTIQALAAEALVTSARISSGSSVPRAVSFLPDPANPLNIIVCCNGGGHKMKGVLILSLTHGTDTLAILQDLAENSGFSKAAFPNYAAASATPWRDECSDSLVNVVTDTNNPGAVHHGLVLVDNHQHGTAARYGSGARTTGPAGLDDIAKENGGLCVYFVDSTGNPAGEQLELSASYPGDTSQIPAPAASEVHSTPASIVHDGTLVKTRL